MTQELLEQTVREWVLYDPLRGARNLDRLAGNVAHLRHSPQEITDALIALAQRLLLEEASV